MYRVTTVLALAALLAPSSGCIGKKKYDAALADNETLTAQVATLEAEKAAEAERAAAAEAETAEVAALEAEMRRSLEAALAQIEEMEQAQEDMKASLESEIESKSVEVEEMKTGLRIRLDSDVLFASGAVTPNAEGIEILKKAGKQLAEFPYQVIVMGHTDDAVVKGSLASKYPTNWELAGARAAAVGRILLEAGVKGEQLAVGSRASFKPIAGNDTPEGQASNRRIEIFVRFIEMVQEENEFGAE